MSLPPLSPTPRTTINRGSTRAVDDREALHALLQLMQLLGNLLRIRQRRIAEIAAHQVGHIGRDAEALFCGTLLDGLDELLRQNHRKLLTGRHNDRKSKESDALAGRTRPAQPLQLSASDCSSLMQSDALLSDPHQALLAYSPMSSARPRAWTSIAARRSNTEQPGGRSSDASNATSSKR